MENNETKKSSEALPDEALDKVTGGVYADDEEYNKLVDYVYNFADRNCYGCSMEGSDVCLLWLDEKVIYNMFGGDPNARCPHFAARIR